MKQPAVNQQRMMWFYIILLLLVIVVLWLIFIKKEIGLNIKETNSPSLGSILTEFKDAISQGAGVLKQAGTELKRLTAPTTTPEQLNLNEEQKADFLEKVQEKLKASSTTNNFNN